MERWNFEPIINLEYRVQILALGKALIRNENTSSAILQSTMILGLISSSFYVNCNVFIVIKNEFEHVLVCWWVTLFVTES